jgi:hypothetical protein
MTEAAGFPRGHQPVFHSLSTGLYPGLAHHQEAQTCAITRRAKAGAMMQSGF